MKPTSQPEITAGDEFIRARRQLIMDDRFVYFGTLAMYMPFVPDPTVKTACVNNVCLRYNLEYVKSLKPEHRRSLVGHELLHPALAHLWRRDGRDLELWNIACDYKVNQVLVQSGMSIPDNWYHDKKYYEYSAEQIYSLLQQQQQKQQQNQPQGGGSGKSEKPEGQNTPGNGQKPSQASGKPDPSSNKPGSQPGNEPGNSSQPGKPSGAPGGRGQGGDQPQMGEPGSGDPGFDNPSGSFTDPIEGGMEEDGTENMGQSDWKIIAQQAASAAKRAGNLPGGLEEALVASREAQVPWEEELKDFFTRTIPNDQTWGNPNRRFIGDGLYLPGKFNQNLGYIAMHLDSSGSMTSAMLGDIAAEITNIISEIRPEYVDVVSVDTKVQRVDRFEPDDDVKLVAVGRGGTAFSPFFKWVEAQEQEPACAVCFTDLAGSDNTSIQEPNYPVLWVTPDYVTAEPPFGRVLRIPNSH